MTWTRTAKTVGKNGTTLVYEARGTNLTIESRLRHVPHAGRSGTWDHTTYFVMRAGKDIKEFPTLAQAKDYAERWTEEHNGAN